jgi:hypothetical protein
MRISESLTKSFEGFEPCSMAGFARLGWVASGAARKQGGNTCDCDGDEDEANGGTAKK